MALIEVRGLTKLYRMGDAVVHALDGVDLDVDRGEFVAITGASGSGKSTLMHLLGCLDRPTAGTYRLDGRDVSSLSDGELAAVRNRKVGFVFQTFNLIPRTSALENVGIPLFYARAANTRGPARRALERVGLTARAAHNPNELSGGERQRVAIARAIVNSPAVLLADEPTGNLDSRTGRQIMEIFQRLNEEGVTVVMVTHEPDIAAQARRIVQMRDGLVLWDGPAAALEPAATSRGAAMVRIPGDAPVFAQETVRARGAREIEEASAAGVPATRAADADARDAHRPDADAQDARRPDEDARDARTPDAGAPATAPLSRPGFAPASAGGSADDSERGAVPASAGASGDAAALPASAPRSEPAVRRLVADDVASLPPRTLPKAKAGLAFGIIAVVFLLVSVGLGVLMSMSPAVKELAALQQADRTKPPPPELLRPVLGFVCGLLATAGVSFISGILAIVLSTIARRRRRREPANWVGGRRAMIGLILGWVSVGLPIGWVVVNLVIGLVRGPGAMA